MQPDTDMHNREAPKTFLVAFIPPMAVSVLLTCYLYWLLTHFPARPEVTYVNLGFKGTLMVMGLLGMFLVTNFRKAEHRAYPFLFSGFVCFAIAFATDSSAELVRTSYAVKLIGERILLVLGFILVLLGHRQWVRYTSDLHQKLEQLTIVDELTGVFNRRHLMRELSKLMAIARRKPDHALCAIMLDIDHFKSINDKYGHAEGDRVLTDVCRLMSQTIRPEDILARLGGEEFVVLLPDSDLEGAQTVAERIRETIKAVKYGPSKPVKASFGVTQSRTNESEFDFLKRLDVAVYESKQRGRDRVSTH